MVLFLTPCSVCDRHIIYKVVADTVAGVLGKQRQNKTWVTNVICDLCDQRQDLKKNKDELEGANNYRDINRKIRKDMQMVKESLV